MDGTQSSCCVSADGVPEDELVKAMGACLLNEKNRVVQKMCYLVCMYVCMHREPSYTVSVMHT